MRPAPKAKVLPLAVMLLLMLQSSLLVSASPAAAQAGAPYAVTPHAPISILNDTDLQAQAAAEGWPGSGTSADPIIIEGLDISSAAWPASFYCQHTSLFLTVRDCVIVSTAVSGNASALLDVSHMSFLNVDASGFVALIGSHCQDITVANCTLEGSTYPGSLGEASPIFFDTVRNITVSGTILEQVGFTRSYFHDGEHVVIENSTVAATSLTIIGCQGTLVADNIFLESQTFGLYLFASNDTTVVRNLFRNGDTGLFIYEGQGGITRNISLRENTFVNVGINFEGSNMTLETMTSEGDLVNGLPLLILKDLDLHGGGLPASGNAYLLLRVSNGTISGVNVQGGNAVFFLCDCEHLTLANCSFSDILGYGIGLTNTADITLRGCVFNNINMAIYSLANSLDTRNVRTVITQCHFSACVESISDADGADFLISENEFVGPGKFGVNLSSHSGTNIVGNVFSDLSDIAIVISSLSPSKEDSSRGMRISGNIIEGCSGIFCSGTMDSLIDNNTVRSSPTTGIVLFALTSNITLTGNWIENCTEYGISVERAEMPNLNNTIFGNILLGNNGATASYDPSHLQASDDASCGTQWSVSGVGGRRGNYYSDLTGPDAHHIGFVDVPYTIAANVSDARPYASLVPYEPTTVIGSFVDESVRLAWSAPSFQGISPITGYAVERQVNDGPWTFVTVTKGTTYVDGNVSRGNDYRYSIVALNEMGAGNGSVPLTVNVRLHDWSLLLIVLAVIVIAGVWGVVIKIGRK